MKLMTVGVPKEIKDHEARVGVVPSGVIALREAGHRVLVQTHAGEGSAITDDEYRAAGADVVCEPEDQPYGMREILVRDPDGHLLIFGHDISGNA